MQFQKVKILTSLFILVAIFSFQFNKNTAFSQTCQNHKVICEEEKVPCCEKFKPHCKDGEPKCCKKKEDGTLKCRDKEGNTYPVECKDSCDEDVAEDENVVEEEAKAGAVEESGNEDASLEEKEVNLKALITNTQVLQVLLGYCTNQCSSGMGALVSKQLTATFNDQQACNIYAGVQANGFPNGLTWINTCNLTAGTTFYDQARTYLIQQCLQSYPNQTTYCTGVANNELATYTCCCDNPCVPTPTPTPVAPLPCGGNSDLVCAGNLTNHASDTNCISGCCQNGTVSWAGYCCPDDGNRYSICPGGGCCNIDTHICQGSRCCPQGKACCGNDPPQDPCNSTTPCCGTGYSCSRPPNGGPGTCCPIVGGTTTVKCPNANYCCATGSVCCTNAGGTTTCCQSGQCTTTGICCIPPYTKNNDVCCLSGYTGCPITGNRNLCCNTGAGYSCPTTAGGDCVPPPPIRESLSTPTPPPPIQCSGSVVPIGYTWGCSSCTTPACAPSGVPCSCPGSTGNRTLGACNANGQCIVPNP